MAFTAPAEELVDETKASGFTAPATDTPKGFTAPDEDVAEFNNRLSKSIPSNMPSQFSSGLPASVPLADNPDWGFVKAATAPGTGAASRVGQALATTGKVLWALPEDMIEQARTGAYGPGNFENTAAVMTGETPPAEAAMRDLPTGQRILASGVKGLVESAPQMGIAAINPVAGALSFGFTPQGFDPKQAAIAAALPVVGKYTGAITEAIAAKAGVTSDSAQAALNKMGGAAGAAGLIGADQLNTIRQLPPDQQKDALIDAVGNVGSMFLLGTMGERHQLDSQKNAAENQAFDAASKQVANATALRNSLPQKQGGFTAPPDEVVPGNDFSAAGTTFSDQPPATEAASVVAKNAPTEPAPIPKPASPSPADLASLQDAMRGNQLAPVDTSRVEVRTPDGQLDHVATAIARIKLDNAQADNLAQNAPADQSLPHVSLPPEAATEPAAPVGSISQPEVEAAKNEPAGLTPPNAGVPTPVTNVGESAPPVQSTLPEPVYNVGDKFIHNGVEKTVTKPSYTDKSVVLDGELVSTANAHPAGEADKVPTGAGRLTNLSTLTDADGDLHNLISNYGKIPAFLPDGLTVANYRRLKNKLAAGEVLSPAERGVWNRVKEIFPQNYEDDYGVNGEKFRQAYDAAKKAGIAHEVFSKTKNGAGLALDNHLDALKQLTGQEYTPGDLWDMVKSISTEHKYRESGKQAADEDKAIQNQQEFDENFRKVNRATTPATEQVPVESLEKGDYFTLKGARLKVTSIQVDDTGAVTGVSLEDGSQYGSQHIDRDAKGNLTLRMDDDSLRKGSHYAAGDFAFDQPESTQDQKTRLAREQQARTAEAAKTAMLAKAGKRLTGSDLDTTKDIFDNAPETRTDKSGQQSMFATGDKPLNDIAPGNLDNPKTRQALDRIAHGEHGKSYADLDDRQKFNIRQQFQKESPDSVQGRQQPDTATGRGDAVNRSVSGLPERYAQWKAQREQWAIRKRNEAEALKRVPRRPDGTVDWRKASPGLVDAIWSGERAASEEREGLHGILNASSIVYKTESDATKAQRGNEVSDIQAQARKHTAEVFPQNLYAHGEGGGLSVEDATAAIHSALGTSGDLPPGIRVVRDEAAPWGAKIEGRNKITVNAAKISTPERARQVILEEGFHGVWSDPAIQKAWQSVRDLVTNEEMRAEYLKRKAQGLPTDPDTIREEAAIDRLVKADSSRGVFARVFDAVRAAFKRIFGFDLPGSDRQQLKDAALSFLRNRDQWEGAKGETQPAFAQGLDSVGNGGDMPDDYKMNHRPNSEGPPAYDLLSTEMAPRDIYDHPDYYTGDPGSVGYQESVRALRAIRGNPNAEVTVYRAAPKNVLNSGDWVSLSKAYSKLHGMADDPSEDVPVHAFKVKAKDVKWDGNTLEEFGYYPEGAKFETGDTGGHTLAKLQTLLEDEFKGLKLDVSDSHGNISLSRIVVPKDARGKGVGTSVMERITQWADANGKRITLSPSADFGGSKPRLVAFYKRFGFVENKGRNADLSVSDSMIREPAKYATGEYLPSEDEDAGPKTIPPRPLAEVYREFQDAEAALSKKTPPVEGQSQKDYKQQAALAGARYRQLRDELKEHPERIADTLKESTRLSAEAKAAREAGDTDKAQDLESEMQHHADDLARLPAKLVARIQDELIAKGELPKGKPLIEPGAGRTLDQMTERLKNGQFDSPKVPLLERLAIGKKLAEAGQGIKDGFTRALSEAGAAWKAGIEAIKHPPTDDDYRAAKKSWIAYDARTDVENYKYAKALVDKVPNSDRRKAMSVWLDANGDESLLKFQAQSVPEAYRRPFELAQKLTAGEKQIALDVKANFEMKAEDAQKAGLMDKTRKDYGVPQRWETAPQIEPAPGSEKQKGSAGNPNAKLDTRDPFFSFHRQTPTYFDGIMAGGKPENLDLAHLVTVYDQAFHKALGSRGWIGALQEARARDGTPVVKVSGKAGVARNGDGAATFVDAKSAGEDAVTADGRPYRAYDHPALKDWKFVSKDAAGNPILVKGDMLIHPDHFTDVKNELETPKWTRKLVPGETRSTMESLGYGALKASSFLKSSKFIGPFHIVTEALHASFHGVVPTVHDFKVDLSDPKQAALSRNMTLGFGKAREMFEEGLGTHGGIWQHVPGLGAAVTRMNHFTFNEYIPRLKMKVGLAVLARNEARYAGKLNPEQIAEITGRQMDAAFGGQNWRLMGANKNALAVTRLGLVAPDFLISRAKVIGQAFKLYNQEQRVFLLAQAAGVYLISRVLNSIFSDDHDPHWEPKNWDSVVIGKRAYHARFIVSDAANLARDLLGLGGFNQHGIPFITGRLGVMPKMGMEVATGKDLFTGQNKDGFFQADNPILKAFSIVARDTAEWMTPMGVDGFLPGAAARGQTGLGSAVAATVGVSSRKESPANDVWDAARKFNLGSADPKAVAYQKQRDNYEGPPSAYRALNNLLDAGQLDKAKREIKTLIASGKTEDQIARHFDKAVNFTGSATREQQFVASLSPAQKKQYDAAKAEQAERAAAFRLAK